MSRTIYHSTRYRRQECGKWTMPWWKVRGGPSSWRKKVWAGEVRSYHKQEMLRDPEDPSLTNPRRITDLWHWY